MTGAYASQLVRLMTGPDSRFPGPAIDLSQVTDEELGPLLAAAMCVPDDREPGPATWACTHVRMAVRERSPLFTTAACASLFAALAETPRHDGPSMAAGALVRCTEPLPELTEHAAILAQQPDRSHYALLALAKLGGVGLAEPTDPLARAEFEVVSELGAIECAVVAEVDRNASAVLAPLLDAVDRLAAVPDYVAFTRSALDLAAARVADIQAGQTPYQADKAFTTAEADVLWRASQVALLRDEPWVGELLGQLLPGVAVAPTSAKTTPSQSVAIALAQAVEAWPTPESVAALREARRVVRHAGVTKKLDRMLRNAAKGLARRPAVALRLPGPDAPTKAQLATLTKALEGGYLFDTTFPYATWHAELATHPHLKSLVGSLIWDIDGTAVLPASAMPVNQEGTVRLWHPLRSTEDERAAWRDQIVELRLTQPFRQAFREHYTVSEPAATTTDMFTGHVVAIRPLLGLAVREGWRVDHLDGVLRRELGDWRAVLAISGSIFPGADGHGDVGDFALEHRDGSQWRPARFADAPPVLVSEALRGVDLLVSVAAFGLDGDPDSLSRLAELPLGEMARMRKAALRRILPDLAIGDRHVHVGPFAVHLSTARVTRDGSPVTIDPPNPKRAVAMPWLPYDERLLERIAHTVVAVQTLSVHRA